MLLAEASPLASARQFEEGRDIFSILDRQEGHQQQQQQPEPSFPPEMDAVELRGSKLDEMLARERDLTNHQYLTPKMINKRSPRGRDPQSNTSRSESRGKSRSPPEASPETKRMSQQQVHSSRWSQTTHAPRRACDRS